MEMLVRLALPIKLGICHKPQLSLMQYAIGGTVHTPERFGRKSGSVEVETGII